jgi:antitoxin VapB
LTIYTIIASIICVEVIQAMGLNLKNQKVEQLAAEVAAMVGETKTEAIRRALEERKQRLSFQVTNRDRKARLKSLLETEVWPLIPKKLLGKRLTRKEYDRILGYGQEGV